MEGSLCQGIWPAAASGMKLCSAHPRLPTAGQTPELLVSQLQISRRRRRCSEDGRGRLGLNAARLIVKQVGLSTAWRFQGPGGGAAWTNTTFQEMLETCNQPPVTQHLNGVKGTVRDKGTPGHSHRSVLDGMMECSHFGCILRKGNRAEIQLLPRNPVLRKVGLFKLTCHLFLTQLQLWLIEELC